MEKMKQTAFRLPVGLLEGLQDDADRRGLYVSALVRMVLTEYLESRRNATEKGELN